MTKEKSEQSIHDEQIKTLEKRIEVAEKEKRQMLEELEELAKQIELLKTN